MSCGHGSTNGNVEGVAGAPSRTLSERSLEQKEHPVSVLVLRDSEQRCIVFTLVTLGLDGPLKFLPPFVLPVQGSDSRNQLGSGAYSDMGDLGLLSPPPAIIFHVNLQTEQDANSPENTGSATSFSARSSGSNVLGQSRNRNKRTKSMKSSRASSASCFIPDNSSGSVLDGLNAVHPDLLIPDCPKVETRSARKSSKKKGKKKGKRYKRSSREDVVLEPEIQCEEGKSSASVYGTSVKSDPAGSDDHISEDKLADKATSSILSVKDIIIEKDDSKVYSNASGKGSAGSLACTSCINEMDVLEPMASSSEGSAGDESSSNSMDQSVSTVMDSHLDGWKSHLSEICTGGIDRKRSAKDESEFSSSESGAERMNDGIAYHEVLLGCDINSKISAHHSVSSSPEGSTEVFDNHNRAERVQCSGQVCGSDGFQPVVHGRRGRLARKSTGSSNAVNRYSSVNMLACTGKDSSQSVWQKVKKYDAEECIHDSNNLPIDDSSRAPETRVRFDTSIGLKQSQSAKSCKFPCSYKMAVQAKLHRTAFSSVDSSELSKSNEVIRKPSSISKQSSQYSWKGSLTDKKNIPRPSKVQIPHKDLSKISQKVNHKCLSSGLQSPCSTNFQRLIATPTNKPGCCQSEQKMKRQSHMEESMSLGNSCSIVHNMTSLAQNDAPLRAKDQHQVLFASDLFDQTCVEEHGDSTSSSSSSSSSSSKPYDNMHVDYCHPADSKNNISMNSEAEGFDAEHSKLGDCSGSLMQDWVPVGRKDSLAYETNETVCDSSKPKNAEVVLSLNPHHSRPLTVRGSECPIPSSEDPDCQSPEADQASSEFKSHTHTEKEITDELAVSNCHLTHEVNDRCLIEADDDDDLNVILRAVTDSYKFQTASESVHVVTGNPVAEFERLLHSASPVLGQIDCIKSCETYPHGQLFGDSLCAHQIPNFSLASLWHWYERPGSYGLEVEVEDHNNSMRLQNGHFQFRAYFVPYLSAVQLFGRANNLMYSSDESSSEELTDAAKVDKEIKPSTRLSSLPIFSKLLPQRRKQDIQLSSSSAKEDLCDQSIARHMGDKELLFEYFESDQPQQRLPLFEKIKELVQADESSAGKMFGNPLNLECLSFHDLHPASWYSVAWYPIYRIPNGNLRASFLTYHSLGHFARRKVSPSSFGGVACLVSPVVGLRSYNVKGECWFQPPDLKTQVVKTEESLALDPRQIFKERLRTLEQTASAMAKASVWKGNEKSVNRQPDYEFFLSRGSRGFSF